MISDEEQAAEDYYLRIMVPGDVLLLKTLLSRMGRVPQPARDYLEGHCRDLRELEEFFEDRKHLFFLKNGRVSLFCEELEEAPQMAADFFEMRLRNLKKPVGYMVLKSQLDHAPESVGTYIRSFYPGAEFKKFLKQWPDVFILRQDDTVFLIELESVTFFKNRLRVFGGGKITFIRFRGHVGQAPREIQAYMNRCFLGDEFQIFLRRNSDVFQLDANGDVSLAPFV